MRLAAMNRNCNTVQPLTYRGTIYGVDHEEDEIDLPAWRRWRSELFASHVGQLAYATIPRRAHNEGKMNAEGGTTQTNISTCQDRTVLGIQN